MNATEARKLADNAIYEDIREHAIIGYTYLRFYRTLDENLMNKLIEDGYKVVQFKRQINNKFGLTQQQEQAGTISW